jgi:hypothetical protein
MPNSIMAALINRVSIVETKVESLLSYQRWQMGFLAAILAAVIGA